MKAFIDQVGGLAHRGACGWRVGKGGLPTRHTGTAAFLDTAIVRTLRRAKAKCWQAVDLGRFPLPALRNRGKSHCSRKGPDGVPCKAFEAATTPRSHMPSFQAAFCQLVHPG